LFYWIYDMPSLQLGLLISAVFVGATWFGIIFFKPFLRLWLGRQDGRNDLVGYTISSLAVFYGLLLGLFSVATYQNYSNVDDNVTKESASLAALYRDFSGYPSRFRETVQEKLREYTRYTIEEGWPLQQKGIVPTGGSDRIGWLMQDLVAFEPATKGKEILHAEALRQMNHYIELRRARLASVTTGIPGVLWAVVIIGSVLNVMLISLYDMKFTVHLVLGGIVSFFLGLSIFLIASLDNPFRGEVSVQPDAIELVYDQLMKPKMGEK
jgi:hypothetical protein